MSLEKLQKTLLAVRVGLSTQATQNAFAEHWPQQSAPFTPRQMTYLFGPIEAKIAVAALVVDEEDSRIVAIHTILKTLQTSHVPNLLSSTTTYTAIIDSLLIIDGILFDIIGHDGNSKALNIPRKLSVKTKAAEVHLEATLNALEGIDAKVETIRLAHDTALDLPVTLQEIQEVRTTLNNSLIAVGGHQNEIERLLKESHTALEKINLQSTSADDLTSRLDDAYRAVTSQGLAKAFHKKEDQLRSSIRWWTGFLVVSLCAMAGIGYVRFPQILRALTASPDWGVVLLDITLAALSIGPAAWFAIVATKQISHRFKLAEDYGYKAAISAAYEGYRTEAQRFGEEFQSRLFSSTLSRLDEQPLRFIDHDSGGSPMHEIVNSFSKLINVKATKEFLDDLPQMLERFKTSSKTKKPTTTQDVSDGPNDS